MHSFLRRTGFGAAAVALVSLNPAAQAAEFPCFDEPALQSARIHDLRVMLMVNALKCRLLRPQTLRSYGDLMDQRGDELTDHSRQVRDAMVDRYGMAMGEIAYNRYETELANYHSIPDPSQRQCDDVAAYINLAARADHGELATLSRLATSRAIDVCLTPLSRSDAMAQTKPLAQPAPAAMTRPVPPAPEPELVDGIPTYSVPGTGPDTAPEPIEKAMLTDAGATAAPPASAQASKAAVQEQRLDQAILALSEAVAALRDLRKTP